jgi:hypothetical protein
VRRAGGTTCDCLRLRGFDAEACLGEQKECPRALARALGEERVLRVRLLELNDTVCIHASVHVPYDLQWHAGWLRAEMHYVLHPARAGNRARRRVGRDAYEDIPWKERLKARARAHERKERVKMLAAKIELDPPLRARLCVDELPGSFAERRHVGVVHVSDFIHNEGDVQSLSKMVATFDSGMYRKLDDVAIKILIDFQRDEDHARI